MADDNPYLSAGGSQPDNPYLKAQSQPAQTDNPYLSAGATASQGRQGMGYPSLGLVPPTAEGTPKEAPMGGNVAFFGGLPKQVLGAAQNPAIGQAAGAEGQAEQTQPGAGMVKKGVEWFLKQPPDYLSNKIGGAIDTAANTVSDYLSKGLGAIGVPQPEMLTHDVLGYLLGGDLAVHGTGVPRMAAEAPKNFIPVINDAAKKYGVEPGLLAKQLQQESGYRDVKSPAGAEGVAQFIPGTAAKYGVDVHDPVSSINGQAHYMSDLKKMFGGNDGLALAGYNWGEGNVQKWLRDGADPARMPAETRNYVKSITGQTIDTWMQGRGRAPEGIRARAAGADVPEPHEAPAPNRQWFNEQDDKFFALRQKHQADEAQFMEMIGQIPDEFKTPEMQERFYKYMENPDSTELSPSEQEFYTKTIEPLKREERDLYEELKRTNLDVADYDPTYAHRIVKGRNPVFDALSGERGATSNPVSGYKSFTASSLKARKFYALEDGKGNRKLVVLDNGQLREINKGTDSPLQPDALATGEENLKGLGDSVKIKGQNYTLKNARTDEIEANTGVRYYKNAMGNTIDNLLRLRSAARAQYLFNELKNSPEFLSLARKIGGNQHIPEGWRHVDMPTFRGWALEPKFADMVDDFYGGTKSALGDKLTKINQLAVRSLFMLPSAHLLNTFAMWSVARGFDVATPAGIRSFLTDMPKAFKAVYTMNKDYREMLDHGAGLVYSGVKNQDFYRQMMNRLGEDIKRVPNQWDPIARIAGVGPSDLIKIIYDGSSKILWGGTDVFLMQRVYELKRKGLSTKDAIVEAEKFIPNYRIPSQVLGSRRFAMLLKDPSLTEFSRYHYGVWKSLAHLANDLAGPKATVAKRFDTIGKIVVGGGLLFGLWPVISYGIQKLTGDKDLEFSPKGSTKIPADLLAWYNGDKQFIDVVSDSIIMAPVLKEGLQQFFNTNFFQAGHNMPGQSIVDKVDQQKGLAHQAIIRGQHAAQTLNAPYGLLDQAGRPHQSLEKSALGLALGTRKKPKKYVPSKYDYKEHGRRPKGLIEKGLDKL